MRNLSINKNKWEISLSTIYSFVMQRSNWALLSPVIFCLHTYITVWMCGQMSEATTSMEQFIATISSSFLFFCWHCINGFKPFSTIQWVGIITGLMGGGLLWSYSSNQWAQVVISFFRNQWRSCIWLKANGLYLMWGWWFSCFGGGLQYELVNSIKVIPSIFDTLLTGCVNKIKSSALAIFCFSSEALMKRNFYRLFFLIFVPTAKKEMSLCNQ